VSDLWLVRSQHFQIGWSPHFDKVVSLVDGVDLVEAGGASIPL
jgi:hypothetical protein